MFWSFTKCWIWQQCWNCVQRHLQTLQSKAELTQKDFVVLYPDFVSKATLIYFEKKSWTVFFVGVPQKPQEELETLGHSYLNSFLDFIISTFPKCFLIPLPLALRNPYQTNCTIWFAILLYNLGLILVQVKVGYSQRVFSIWSNPEKNLFNLKWFISFFWGWDQIKNTFSDYLTFTKKRSSLTGENFST